MELSYVNMNGRRIRCPPTEAIQLPVAGIDFTDGIKSDLISTLKAALQLLNVSRFQALKGNLSQESLFVPSSHMDHWHVALIYGSKSS